ncbi:MAG: hypothetical protein Q9173_001275 [Seirophora scorigena]
MAQIAPIDLYPCNRSLEKEHRPRPKLLTPILGLPDELMLIIMAHLPDPNIVALSYTCSRFYRIATRVVENIVDRYHHPSESTIRLRHQLYFRRLLEINAYILRNRHAQSPGLELPPSRRKQEFKCVGCKRWNDSSSFSLGALRGPAATRQCIFHEGRLWICPAHHWTYDEPESSPMVERVFSRLHEEIQRSCKLLCLQYLRQKRGERWENAMPPVPDFISTPHQKVLWGEREATGPLRGGTEGFHQS